MPKGGEFGGGATSEGEGPAVRVKKWRWKEEGSKAGVVGKGKGVRSDSTMLRPGCCQCLPANAVVARSQWELCRRLDATAHYSPRVPAEYGVISADVLGLSGMNISP